MIEDVIADGLDVLFCGINPGLMSEATGHHFARPGNRFWPGLFKAGFTPRLLLPAEQGELLTYGLGITNVVARPSAKADELSKAEIREGGERLAALAEERRPRWIAVLGVGAYRTAFRRPKAAVGPQEAGIGPARAWLLPNPSGLNAHYTLDGIAAEFARLREAADVADERVTDLTA
ncbi:mismatch-specific DNA-glycosylase [Actinorhabdospora filicis]|uniref:Mismatch-specific DNA-glycosylase n=1 Tax=Actinorhabdospora filicis TaxID=1785913 RepID=A0A9W6WCG6_9ACTN|nr:G/U mismatch-specific DNA glycosylase [Actinorhabdospora filicis]GLZ80571.1 mismatch-specific DNA-glycosylase [Actinorhabdospora filicis]